MRDHLDFFFFFVFDYYLQEPEDFLKEGSNLFARDFSNGLG